MVTVFWFEWSPLESVPQLSYCNTQWSCFECLNTYPLLSVNLNYFPDLLTLEMTTCDLNFVVFSYRHRTHIVFLAEFFGERWTHNLPPHTGGGCKVSLPVFSPWGGNVFIQLHLANRRWTRRTSKRKTRAIGGCTYFLHSIVKHPTAVQIILCQIYHPIRTASTG